MRVLLNSKETRKTRGGLISGGAYNGMYFFSLQVDGPVTGRTYKGGAYKRQGIRLNSDVGSFVPY